MVRFTPIQRTPVDFSLAATSRGIFRIPGAHSTINALYNHYASQDEDGEVVNGTVRCPTLPEHIQCNVNDVASAFKKFLAGLPGGILGKAWLFDAFMSIYSQLDAEAELMRTKQSKVRARLIALAIATVAPRYQRELICAVLGLLSMIGRAAETAPREDKYGRPLPTSDLMGYGALGIVFGPLLMGDLLDGHDLCPTGPHGSLVFIQRSPPKSSSGKHKKNESTDDPTTLLRGTDKIRIVNSITEMLITHWRDVVRHMKNLGALKRMKQHYGLTRENTGTLAPPLSPELFAIRRPRDWDVERTSKRHVDRSTSPTPSSRELLELWSFSLLAQANRPHTGNGQTNNPPGPHGHTTTEQDDTLSVRKRRPRPRPMSSQILSGAKSMSILVPTIEEIPGEERHEQLVLDSDHEVTQNTVHLNEKCGVKASQSTQTFHTARSEQVGKSNPEQFTAVNAGATPHLVKYDQISIESNTKISKKAPEDGRDDPNVYQQVLNERGSSGDRTKLNATDMDRPGTRQIRASHFHEKQKQSEELSKPPRVISSPLGSSNCVQNQPAAFSPVPTGIVSSRLRSIAASDPGLDPPSMFHEILKTDHKGVYPQKRRPNTTTGGSHTFEHFPQDPLSRVSHEEDIASLASLAEVIQSQDEIVCLDSLLNVDLIKRPDTPVNVVKSRARSTVSVTSISELHNVESSSKTASRKDVEEGPASTTKTISPADADRLPITPRRSATESSVPHRSGGSSVKALAARFGNAETNSRQTPSPVHTPDSRVWHGSLVEKSVVATYTINTSPVPIVQRLNRLDTPVQNAPSPSRMRVRTVVSPSQVQSIKSSLLPKPLFSNSYLQEDVGPPRWPKLRPVDRSLRSDIDLVQVGHNNITLPPFSSNLHRTADGNVSFALSRKSSLGTILPRPDEPPVAGHMDFARPAAMYTDCYAAPFDLSTCSPFMNNGISSSSVVGQRPRNQSTSTLYTQIQHLSRELRAKADEADHLRRQLMTKDSLNDLSTLSQHLRQAKRELSVWRGRAEVAEKRLEMISQLSQKEVDEAIADEPSATNISGISGNNFAEDRGRSKTQNGNTLHGLGGIWTDHDLPGSEGTIRRASPEQ